LEISFAPIAIFKPAILVGSEVVAGASTMIQAPLLSGFRAICGKPRERSLI
jgi:hypothetical protein